MAGDAWDGPIVFFHKQERVDNSSIAPEQRDVPLFSSTNSLMEFTSNNRLSRRLQAPPLVSICIPTYNRPEYLLRALRSCLAQTYSHFEIIVTDNSTNDESREAIRQLHDPRIAYHKNPTNLGPCGNTNRATSLATGEYVKLLMDDDLLKPACLERMVAALETHPTAGVAMAPMEIIDEDDQRIFPRFYVFRKMHHRYRYQAGDDLINRRVVLREFLTRDYPCCVPSGIMFRAECFTRSGLFDPAADFAGDLDKLMQVAVHYDFAYIDQTLSSWRYLPTCHTASLHQTGLNIGAFYYITKKILADDTAMNLFPAAEQEQIIRDSYFFCSCRALLNGLAGLRARSPRLIADTVKTIFKEDPYWSNKFRLPWFVIREIGRSVFSKHQPPPRE
jgi:glycosyltransferase domain-containing protein